MNGTNPSLTEASARGRLKVNVVSQATSRPVPEANVSISYTGVPDSLVEQLSTDASGQTSSLELEAPPLEYSLEESSEQQPYAEYTIQVEAPGYEPVSVAGAEILPDVTALQNIALPPRSGSDPAGEVFVIPAHTLYGSYPAKIPESEIKPVTETGEHQKCSLQRDLRHLACGDHPGKCAGHHVLYLKQSIHRMVPEHGI